MSKKKNDTSFLVQGSILAIASLVSRVIGLVYRIPLTAIIGDHGNDYYSCAYEIYSLLLLISSYSLPMAVSKMVSARISNGERQNAYRVFKGRHAVCCYYRNNCLCDRIFRCGRTDTAVSDAAGCICPAGTGTNADHRCGIRCIPWIFPGNGNDDPKCCFHRLLNRS